MLKTECQCKARLFKGRWAFFYFHFVKNPLVHIKRLQFKRLYFIPTRGSAPKLLKPYSYFTKSHNNATYLHDACQVASLASNTVNNLQPRLAFVDHTQAEKTVNFPLFFTF